jgi:tetratricopeptide (TPR) repeat protein
MDKAPRKDRILPKVKYYLQKAQYRRGQFDAVTSIYTRDGRGFAPLDQPEMHYLAGQSFLHQKNYASAISAFIQIPRGNDYYPFALYSLGLAYRGFGDTFAAQQAFHKLIERDPEDHPRLARLIERSSLTLGLMLLEQSRYREAIAVLQELSVQSDFFAQALFGIGWSYMKLEEYVKAIVAFGDLIERRPESQFAQEGRLVKGYCYSKLRAYGKAVDHYRKVLEISSHQISSLTQEMHTLQQGGTDLSLIRASVRLNTVEDRQDLFRAIEKYEELTHLLSSEQSAGPQATQRNTQMKTQFQAFETQFAFILKEMALQTLQERREWFEDLSVHAGIGIAKNLTLEKTEFGGKELILDY